MFSTWMMSAYCLWCARWNWSCKKKKLFALWWCSSFSHIFICHLWTYHTYAPPCVCDLTHRLAATCLLRIKSKWSNNNFTKFRCVMCVSADFCQWTKQQLFDHCCERKRRKKYTASNGMEWSGMTWHWQHIVAALDFVSFLFLLSLASSPFSPIKNPKISWNYDHLHSFILWTYAFRQHCDRSSIVLLWNEYGL